MNTGFGVFLSPLEKGLVRRLEGDGAVVFEYRKSTGILRRARGTRNLKLIPPSEWPREEEVIETKVNYYDLERHAWRSFKLGSVLCVE